MPTKRTPQKLASKNKLEATSARKAGAQLAAKTSASREICPDGSMGAAKTSEEGSQNQPKPDPSGGRGGHTEVKAQTGATRDTTTANLISDEQESEVTLGVGPSKGLAMSPKKKGRFDQKSPDGDTGERHVPPEVQAPVDDMEDVGLGNDGEENNLASHSFGSDTENLASLSFGSDMEYRQKRML
jgi:hypothetical protein